MINIANRMREILPELKRGINDIRFPEIQPECEVSWNENYAIINRVYYDLLEDAGSDYFDHQLFKLDFETLIKSKFTDTDIKFNFKWLSQEIEVYRKVK